MAAPTKVCAGCTKLAVIGTGGRIQWEHGLHSRQHYDKYCRHHLCHVDQLILHQVEAADVCLGLIYNGVDAVTVSHRLGHDQVSTTTDIYSHMMADADSRSADVISDALNFKKA